MYFDCHWWITFSTYICNLTKAFFLTCLKFCASVHRFFFICAAFVIWDMFVWIWYIMRDGTFYWQNLNWSFYSLSQLAFCLVGLKLNLNMHNSTFQYLLYLRHKWVITHQKNKILSEKFEVQSQNLSNTRKFCMHLKSECNF